MERRKFLSLVVRGAVLAPFIPLLSACTPERPDNSAFLLSLESKLGFGPGISREELARHMFDLSRAQNNWNENAVLGELVDSSGRRLTIRTDAVGEPIPHEASGPEIRFPFPRNVYNAHFVSQNGQNHMVVYGSWATADVFEKAFQDEENRRTIEAFLNGYFRGDISDFRTVHISFCPRGTQVPWELIGDSEELRKPLPASILEFSNGHTAFLRTPPTGRIAKTEVFFDMEGLENDARYHWGSRQQSLRGIFANEAAAFLAESLETNPNRPRPNEAPSTIIDYLAGLDDRWAHLALGSTEYTKFFDLLTPEMQRLAENN